MQFIYNIKISFDSGKSWKKMKIICKTLQRLSGTQYPFGIFFGEMEGDWDD